MKKILEVKDLHVSYHTYAGEVQSVRGVSFDVQEGETVAIVGESGCGKSVTAKAIMGLLPPGMAQVKEPSQIIYQGKDLLKQSRTEWEAYRGAKCSMIFQDALASLNPTMQIGKQIMENILNHQKITTEAAKARAIEMLEWVGIPDATACIKKYPHELSGGMRQRVMIAIALSTNPEVLIADEPTTALDVTIQAQILDLMKKLQKQFKTSILFITHDLGVVASIADRIVVMYSGKVVERGGCQELFYHSKHPYTWALINAAPNLELGSAQQLVTIEGTPPNLLNPPKGCPFAARCEYCMEICVEEFPPEYTFETGHTAACWLHHPESGYQGMDFSKDKL